MTTKDRLAKALKALELAESIMDYCQGDSWERECTAEDRKRFAQLVMEVKS